MNNVSVTVVGRDRAIRRIDAIKLGLTAVQRRVASQSGGLLKRAIQLEAPSRTGNMRRRIGYRTRSSGGNIQVRFTGPWYSHLVTKGTKAHDIWAGFYTGKSDKRFLAFSGGGAAHVHHPGSRANDFPHRALDATRAAITEVVRVAGASLMGR